MAKDINLTSQEWCDIVFEGKNKKYGAYTIRRTTSKRHLIALIAILVVTLFIATLPALVAKVAEVAKTFRPGIEETTVFADLKQMEEIEEENIAHNQEAPPPPPLISTIKFTPPEIVDRDEITDDDAMKSQDELAESKVTISVYNVDGTDEKGAVDLADLERNRTITGDPEPDKVYDFVEQMPEFPGGMQELYAYLQKKTEYPQQARELGIQGITLVQFVVDRYGAVGKVTVEVSSHPLLDKEAVRVVRSLPKWVPGKINGKPVACYYRLPIVFELR